MTDDSVRREIAALAAQFIADGGLDYRRAKQKAAAELYGEHLPRAAVPDNDQIDEALREHLELFDADAHGERLARMRRAALALMDQLAQFNPYVTGAAWKGIATEHANLHLQVFAEDTKEVMIDLINRGFDPQPADPPPARNGRRSAHGEAVEFDFDGVPVLLSIHDRDAQRAVARSADGAGPARGSRAQLAALLAARR